MGSKERRLSCSIAFKIEVVITLKNMETGQLKAFWLTSDREDDTRMGEAKERFIQRRLWLLMLVCNNPVFFQ